MGTIATILIVLIIITLIIEVNYWFITMELIYSIGRCIAEIIKWLLNR